MLLLKVPCFTFLYASFIVILKGFFPHYRPVCGGVLCFLHRHSERFSSHYRPVCGGLLCFLHRHSEREPFRSGSGHGFFDLRAGDIVGVAAYDGSALLVDSQHDFLGCHRVFMKYVYQNLDFETSTKFANELMFAKHSMKENEMKIWLLTMASLAKEKTIDNNVFYEYNISVLADKLCINKDKGWRNIIREYEMASERESMTEEEIDRLIAETNTARKKLAEPRPYCFHRNSLVRLPDGSERYIYQKMSSDSTRSKIILNAPKAKPDDKMPNFEKTE